MTVADDNNRTIGGLPIAPDLLVPVTQAGGEQRSPFATLIGADYSARSITAQRADGAPPAVRAALRRFATADADSGLDLARGYVLDAGDAGARHAATWDAAWELIIAHAREAHARGHVVAAIGGDHSVSWPLVTAAAEAMRKRHGEGARLGIVQLDAHHDVRPLVDGPSNGTPFRGLIEDGAVLPHDIVQIGIHPFGNRGELGAWCVAQRITCVSADEARDSTLQELERTIAGVLASCDSVYVSIDIDVLDRAFAPGTVAALPGGLDPATLVALVRAACCDPRIIGLDVVEFDPSRDIGGITAYAAAYALLAGLSSVAARVLKFDGVAPGQEHHA